ncbi:MAG: hypothetical protein LBK62_02475 [Treponema sp.]|nr:hypothetical protein [Treponema sp.]
MRRRWKIVALITGIILILAAPVLVFLSRPPVLIVVDASFTALYGQQRMLLRQIRSSLILFRQVKPVMIAEGAGPDIVPFAIGEVASRSFSQPYCVLFPNSYAESVPRYREQFPGVPAILLEGRISSGIGARTADNGGLFVFSTDQEKDFYRMGLCAAIFSGERREKIIVFQDQSTQESARNAFVEGLREGGNGTEPLFLNSFSELLNFSDISCVVLAGSGAEYFERNLEYPVILCTWLDPDLTAREAALIFDDSPWGLAVPAARMLRENQNRGRLPSDLLILPERIADKGVLRQLKKIIHDFRQNSTE